MAKRTSKATAETVIESTVGVVPAGDAKRAPFSRHNAIANFRSWVYAAAMKNAQQVASTPLRLYSRNRSGSKLFRTRRVEHAKRCYLLGESDRAPSSLTVSKLMDFGSDFEEVTERHPVLELLRKVNPWMGGFDAITLTVLHAELTGDWYWVPVQSEVGPQELWLLAPQWTSIVPSRTDFIAGYLYGQNQADRVMFSTAECLHGRYPNPGDPFYGLGKVEAGWGVVQKSRAVEDFDLASFQNNARPDFALIVKSGAKQKELDGLEASVRSKLEGVKRAGRFFTMTGDVDLKPLSWPPKDMNGRGDIVEEIAAIFGVPVTILKANDPNLASAQIGYASWKEMTILPICRMIEDFINQQLLPMFGIEDDACVAFDDPVPKNRAEDRLDAESWLRNGRITLNEDRIANGRDPYDDPMADVPLWNGQPLGYTPPTLGQPSPVQGGQEAPEPETDTEVEDAGDGQEEEMDSTEAEKAVRTAEPVQQAPSVDPEPLPITDAERIAVMVERHNEANPHAMVTLDDALSEYEKALSGVKGEDLVASIIADAKRAIDNATPEEAKMLLMELNRVA